LPKTKKDHYRGPQFRGKRGNWGGKKRKGLKNFQHKKAWSESPRMLMDRSKGNRTNKEEGRILSGEVHRGGTCRQWGKKSENIVTKKGKGKHRNTWKRVFQRGGSGWAKEDLDDAAL